MTCLYPNTCQNPEPRDSNWREVFISNTSSLQECETKCKTLDYAIGFQYNHHDNFCGCLSVAPGKTIQDIIHGKHVFKGSCTIGDFIDRK